MTDDQGLHVEVRDSEIVVMPHTRFTVAYYKLPNDPQLYLDIRSLPTLAEAWQLAHLRAHELGGLGKKGLELLHPMQVPMSPIGYGVIGFEKRKPRRGGQAGASGSVGGNL